MKKTNNLKLIAYGLSVFFLLLGVTYSVNVKKVQAESLEYEAIPDESYWNEVRYIPDVIHNNLAGISGQGVTIQEDMLLTSFSGAYTDRGEGHTGNNHIRVYRYDGTAPTSTQTTQNQNDLTFIASSTIKQDHGDNDSSFDNTQDEWVNYTFSNPPTLEAGKTYFFFTVTDDTDETQPHLYWFADRDNIFQGNGLENKWNADTNSSDFNHNDSEKAFKIYGEEPISPTINLTNPKQGDTIPGSRNFAYYSYDFDDSSTKDGFVSVEFSTSSSNAETLISGSQTINNSSSTSPEPIVFDESFRDAGITQATTTMYGFVSLYENTSTTSIQKATNQISFTVQNQDFSVGETFASTTMDGAFQVDCSQYSGASIFSSSTIDNLTCNAKKVTYDVIGFLVLPQDWANNLITGQIQSLKNKFPFSLIFSIGGEIQDAAENPDSKTEKVEFNYNNSEFNLNSTVLSSSTLENAVGSSTKATIFDGMKAVIWTAAGITILGLL